MRFRGSLRGFSEGHADPSESEADDRGWPGFQAPFSSGSEELEDLVVDLALRGISPNSDSESDVASPSSLSDEGRGFFLPFFVTSRSEFDSESHLLPA